MDNLLKFSLVLTNIGSIKLNAQDKHRTSMRTSADLEHAQAHPLATVAKALGLAALMSLAPTAQAACSALLDRSFARLQDEKPQDL